MKKKTTLILSDILMEGIERIKAIEPSELGALSYLCSSTGDYFKNSDISVKSIAAHWARFIKLPSSAFIHPLQLEEAVDQFLYYLAGKKPYRQRGVQDMRESIKRFVADRLLQIAFEKDCLVSARVTRRVESVLKLRGITGNLAQLVHNAYKTFGELLRISGIDMEQLPQQVQQAVKQALLDLGDLLIKEVTTTTQLALEADDEGA